MRLAASLLLCIAIPVHASAQAVTPWPSAGTRVRVTAPVALPVAFTGQVILGTTDTLTLARASGHLRIAMPASEITRVEVSRGRPHGAWTLAGLGIGALVGGVLGAAIARPSNPNNDPWGVAGLAGFIAGAVLTAPVGAVAGYYAAPEQWSPYWARP